MLMFYLAVTPPSDEFCHAVIVQIVTKDGNGMVLGLLTQYIAINKGTGEKDTYIILHACREFIPLPS